MVETRGPVPAVNMLGESNGGQCSGSSGPDGTDRETHSSVDFFFFLKIKDALYRCRGVMRSVMAADDKSVSPVAHCASACVVR